MNTTTAAAGDPRRAAAHEAVTDQLLEDTAMLLPAQHTHRRSPTRMGHQLKTPRWPERWTPAEPRAGAYVRASKVSGSRACPG